LDAQFEMLHAVRERAVIECFEAGLVRGGA
jgi:hypothetical protein